MPLTSGRNTPRQNADVVVAPVAGNTKIFEGSLVVIDQGNAKPGAEAAGLVAAGRAEEYVDNTGGAAGDKKIRVRRGTFLFENDAADPVTNAHLLTECYILDDETVTSEGEGRSVAGKVLGLDPEGVWVEIK
ncbi:MAG: hypothetical protein JJT76_12905 [Clostridiaceae bacterium]|nr:hypothetical protein [Clostridiaceae bacterium]